MREKPAVITQGSESVYTVLLGQTQVHIGTCLKEALEIFDKTPSTKNRRVHLVKISRALIKYEEDLMIKERLDK